MKKLSAVFGLFLILGFQCEEQVPNERISCIDPERINPEAICTMEYNPVCGCDGKTYSNPCIAANAGVISWEEGTCGR